jgi:amino-acid N-acetyltransferase
LDITPAAAADLREIRGLLERCHLPAQDIEPHIGRFLVAKDKGTLAGVVGLEIYGKAALLRSLAVAPSRRGAGLAQALCKEVLSLAAREGATTVYLLTETAAGFFRRKFGFEDTERTSAPPQIKATREFSQICAATARLLKLNFVVYNAAMETVDLKVEGMDCEGCVKSVTRMLAGVPGVEKVNVSLAEGKASVTYDPAKSGIAQFKKAVERAGYKAP